MPPTDRPTSVSLPEALVVALAVVIGSVLRFWAESPLWLDEALTVNTAQLPFTDIAGALGRDGLPPLYYWLLSGWMGVFGDSDLAARSLAGVLSVATLPLMYFAGSRLGGERAGLVALAFLALNPYAIRYGTEARMYAFIMLLVLAGYLLVDAALRSPRLPALVGIGAVTAGLMYSHYWTFWLLGAVGSIVAVRVGRASNRDDRNAVLRVLVAMAVGAIAFVPWLPTFLEQAAHTATPWADASRPTQILALTVVDAGGGDVSEGILLGFALAVFFLLGIFARPGEGWSLELDLRTVPDARGPAAVSLLTLAFGAIAGLATTSAFATRYVAVVFPLLLLVSAVGAARIGHRGVLAAAVGGVMLFGFAVSVHNARTDRTQAGEIAAAIEAGDPDGRPLGDPVVVYCPDQLGPAVHRLLPEGRFDQVVFPELESAEVESPGRVDWYDYADRQAATPPEEVAAAVLERAGPDNAIWVVFNPSYRAVDERCTDLLDELGRQREGQPIVTADPTRFFEHAGLQLYRPETP